ncbi:MAG: PIN domain-containing protein, partial [Pseudomonadota bacterium]
MITNADKRVFVLDTNVLMHDPAAIFRFDEHDVYLPMMVLEEIDSGKKGRSEAARNARQCSRFIDDLIRNLDKDAIDAGIALADPFTRADGQSQAAGRLFFETTPTVAHASPAQSPDNKILACTLALQSARPDEQVTLVSKDVNLRIKAAVAGVHAEDYYNDQTLRDVDLLYTG